MSEQMKYINKPVDYEKSLKPSEPKKDYVPEMLGLTGLGLYGLSVKRHGLAKANKGVKEGLKSGMKAVKLPVKGGAGVALNVGKRAVGKAGPKIKAFEDGYDAYRTRMLKKMNIALGEEIPKDVEKAWRAEYKEKMSKANELVAEKYKDFAEKNKFTGDYNDLTGAQKNEFQNFFKNQYKLDLMKKENAARAAKGLPPVNTKDFMDKVDMSKEFGFDPSGKLNPKKKTFSEGVSSNLAGGLGFGAAVGLGNLAVHSMGEKYFASKDDERTRELIRQSYETKYNSPQKRVEQMNNRSSQNRPPQNRQHQNRPIQKQAGIEVELANKVKNHQDIVNRRKDIIEALGESVVDPVIFTGIPLAVSQLIGKDLKNGLKPMPLNDGSSPDSIIIDVPIDSLQKKANIAIDESSATFKEMLDSIKQDEHAARFLRNRRKALIKTIPWAITTGIVASKLNPAIANQNVGTPVPEGHARITISTKPDAPQADMSYMINKSAGVRADRDNDRTDDLDEFIDKIRKAMAKSTSLETNPEKAMNFQPSDNIVGKQKSFNRLG